VAKVAIVRCADYEPGRVLEAARRAFDLLGGLGRVIQPGQKVLVKPNLLSAAEPDRAVTTHPSVVRAMVTLAREAGATVWVGDSPGGIEWNVTARVLDVTGVGAAAREAGAEVKDFDAATARLVECPQGAVLKHFALAGPVLDADLVVSVPKLKTHGQALYTGAVKNLLGCVPGGGKIRMHRLAPQSRQLAAALLDIYAVVRPRLALIDAIVAMEGAGPNHGDPRPLGLLLASEDAVAADAVACHVIGYPPRSIHILSQATERGLGEGRLSHIEVVGEPLESVVCPDFARSSNLLTELIPGPLARLISRAIAVDPVIDSAQCRRCGVCQRSCPAGAIGGEDMFVIDPALCTRCFCCHELCPHDAVVLQRSVLVRVYERFVRRRRGAASQEAGRG
jgi:uncharacterized protein (DUF362 family)/Pyruvate/2-oxoacid:ferredoxin oxidoreductase delta subunit